MRKYKSSNDNIIETVKYLDTEDHYCIVQAYVQTSQSKQKIIELKFYIPQGVSLPSDTVPEVRLMKLDSISLNYDDISFDVREEYLLEDDNGRYYYAQAEITRVIDEQWGLLAQATFVYKTTVQKHRFAVSGDGKVIANEGQIGQWRITSNALKGERFYNAKDGNYGEISLTPTGVILSHFVSPNTSESTTALDVKSISWEALIDLEERIERLENK